jgi:hypothetical protein
VQDKSRLIRLSLIGLGFALALAIASVGVRRHGPEMAEYGGGCGPTNDQPCYLPLLNAGWPLAYVVDNPDAPVQERLGREDEVRPERFVVDVLFYFALLSIAWRYGELRRRMRTEHRRRAQEQDRGSR